MGQEASKPQPGARLRVIGAGMPRTGTASFSKALEILLQGPVYHGGTQNCKGSSSNLKSWISVLEHTPIRSFEDEEFVLNGIAGLTDGYMAITSAPGFCFVPELMRLYPDAKVICTVRDAEAWDKSIDAIATASLQWYLRFVLFPLLPMRYFPRYLDALAAGRWLELYDTSGKPEKHVGMRVWQRHIQHLRDVVPPDKLVFFNVKDGWGPLCEALGCDIPKGIEFPRVNERAAMEAFAKEQVKRGFLRWALIFGIFALVIAFWRFWLI
ncbi:P-loop containing nucleoside triphosphate hydrolase protein [Hypoxylon trugodes]|uniref:P-loop containing nucleoside triphosphate hydrolase protein n=1 Tax=Hypoxylon trugodes TaxID=326681 RepID=UPI00219A47E8|nr:P-loop containing nucleoside triphosphate hydrolase protein [Hypoxylon trugodes]KAI1383339.1 P-loop containing nucleoside triphosphate hydrolase protein [Hypoxylon trugodes]